MSRHYAKFKILFQTDFNQLNSGPKKIQTLQPYHKLSQLFTAAQWCHYTSF